MSLAAVFGIYRMFYIRHTNNYAHAQAHAHIGMYRNFQRLRDGSRFDVTRNRPNLKWISLKRAAHTHTHSVCMSVVECDREPLLKGAMVAFRVLTKRGLVLRHALICFRKFPFHWIGSKCLDVMLFKWISAECETRCAEFLSNITKKPT